MKKFTVLVVFALLLITGVAYEVTPMHGELFINF